jgi:nucleoside phosphorylase
VSPLGEEIAPFLARVEDREAVRIGGRPFVRGRVGATRVLAGATGDGARRAAAVVTALLEQERVSGLLVLGVAGALTPGLGVGTVVVSDEILHEGSRLPAPDPELAARLPDSPHALRGAVVTASRLVATPAERRRLCERWGRARAAVDLESGPLAAAAALRGVGFLALRAITDDADETLPGFLLASADGDGHVRRGRLLARALLPPTRLWTLVRLAGRVRLCAGRLADLAEGLLLASPPGR